MGTQFSSTRYDKNKIKEEYDTFYETTDFKQFPIAERSFVNSIVKSNGLAVNSSLLDVACGTGKYTNLFTRQGIKATGVDISNKAIEVARKKYPQAAFQVADIMNMPFTKESYDTLFCSGLSIFNEKNLDDTCDVVKYLLSFIKPGGTFIFLKTSSCTNDWSRNNTRFDHSLQSYASFFGKFENLKIKEKGATIPHTYIFLGNLANSDFISTISLIFPRIFKLPLRAYLSFQVIK